MRKPYLTNKTNSVYSNFFHMTLVRLPSSGTTGNRQPNKV